MKYLARTEELILLAIMKLKDNAYGVTIRELIIELTQKHWSIGAIYDILDQLERKRFVKPVIGNPTLERGGKRKRYYLITKEGFAALEEVREIQNIMWSDYTDPIFE